MSTSDEDPGSIRERNRQVVARYWNEFWTNQNPDIVDEVCSDEFTAFYPMHGRSVGKTAVKQVLA
ncbi:hypothetical protein Plec18167_008031, partial [Paecilomyces lecythidis]